jgi:AraC-like DNA-binding protein
MLGFAGWYDNQPYRDILFYVPLPQLYFIGPVIFFYIQSLLNPSFRFGKKQWLHLLPGIGYLLYSMVIFITDKLILHKYYFLADGIDRDFDIWYQVTGFFSMIVYLFFSLRYYQLYKKLMVQVISYADTVLFRWVHHFLMAFLAMQLLELTFFIGSFFFANLGDYVGSWWKFFSFSLIFYYIAITGYANSVQTKVPFRLHLLGYKNAMLLNPPLLQNDTNPVIEEAEVIEIQTKSDVLANEGVQMLDEWKPKIRSYIVDQQAYQDPELSLTQVSKALKTNPTIISKVINQGFQLNFNDFINQYRIEAVKDKLKAGEQKTQTLLGIAYDCGFNSKATFNRAFKKVTGLSPKQWLEGQLS